MFYKRFDRFSFKKIQHRITLNFTVLMTITLLLMLLVINFMTSRALLRQLTINAEKDLQLYEEQINAQLMELFSFQYNVISDDDLQTFMSKSTSLSLRESQNVNAILKGYTNNYPMINGVFAFDTKGKVINPIYQKAPYDQLITNYKELDEFLQSNKTSKLSVPTLFPLNPEIHKSKSLDNLSYFIQYIDINSLKKTGYLLISFKRNWVFETITKDGLGIFDALAILDEKDQPIFYIQKHTTEGEITIEDMKTSHDLSFFLDEHAYIRFQTHLKQYNNWRIVGLMPQSMIIREIKPINHNLILIVLSSLIVMFVFSLWISEKITHPINLVMRAFNKFEQKKWPEPIEHYAKDETQQLTESVNNLFCYIQQLLKEIQTEHEENLTLEFDLLQAQINPHFIHNTMNALECIALEKDEDEIATTIQAMNYLFRLSMSLKGNSYSVQKEIECIQHFVQIMSLRYPDRFSYTCDISPQINGFEIPKFLLQPIVENSIFHGILPCDHKGIITINGYEEESYMIFIVQDNGIGFHSKELCSHPSHHSRKGYGHIGLNNIKDRLSLYYKDDFVFTIDSSLGKGTTITIKIPKKGLN